MDNSALMQSQQSQQSQQSPRPLQYTNLVLEGGGVLGIAHCGGLEEMESRGILKNIINFAGASAGAIICGILACGGSSAYVTSVMKKMDFRAFADYGNFVRAAYNVLRYKGACPGDYFCQWYSKVLHDLTGSANITFAEHHARYGGRLVIAVVNLSKRRLEFWDHKTRPDVPIALGVRASMSIEFVFMPVEIDGDLYVDGGTLCNYPIQAFHYNGPDGDIINPHTIGMMLMTNKELDEKYPPVRTLIEYSMACIECIWGQPQKLHMDNQDWARTIKIPVGAISSIDFSISREEVKTLIAAGRKAVSQYFEGGVQVRTGTFHCIRAEHTPEDDMKSVQSVQASVQSVQSREVHSVQFPRPTSEDWDNMYYELGKVDEYVRQSAATHKIKQTVGSSPPINIPAQFQME